MSYRVRSLLGPVLWVATILSVAMSAVGPKPVVNTRGGLAVRSYEAVSYFTDGRAARGDSRFDFTWSGAVWRFVSGAHRDLCKAAPEQYAPRFGGYCAWAVAHGYLADGDPEAWTIVDGRLYLNYSRSVQQKWEKDIPRFIASGQASWPGVLNK